MVPASWTSPSVASSSRHPGEKQAPWCCSPSCLSPSCPAVEPPFPRSQPAGAPLGLCLLRAAGEVVGEWGLEPALACTNTQSTSLNLDPGPTLGAVPAPEAAEGPLQLFPLYQHMESRASAWRATGWAGGGTGCPCWALSPKEKRLCPRSALSPASPPALGSSLGLRAFAESHYSGGDGEASSGQFPRTVSPLHPICTSLQDFAFSRCTLVT